MSKFKNNLEANKMITDRMVDDLMREAIDTHIHSNPHYGGKKNLDAIEAAKQAEEAGMRAIVLKCGTFPSGGVAYLVSKLVKKIKVFGGITLNRSVGGLNPVALEKAITYGEGNPGEFTKVVWMPTLDAQIHVRHEKRPESDIIQILRDGKLVPEMTPIFDLVAKHDLILATSHLAPEEIFPIIEEGKKRGVKKIIITHPHNVVPYIPIPRQQEMARMGAWIEHCYVMATKYYLDKYGFSVNISRIADDIKAVGPKHCILATDLGADPGINPPPVVGMRMFMKGLLENGITPEEVEEMKLNSARLLGLG